MDYRDVLQDVPVNLILNSNRKSFLQGLAASFLIKTTVWYSGRQTSPDHPNIYITVPMKCYT